MARTLGDAFVRIRPDMSTFPAEMNRGVDASSRGVSSRLGNFAKAAGAALGAAGVYGAVAFTKGAVQLEAEFGKTMNQLQANLQAPKREMRELDALAMKMGADTVFSAKDASDAMLELARGGLSAAAIKGGALNEALTVAAAGGVGMERAATVMGNALNTFNLRAAESSRVSAALAGAANASSASIDSVAMGLAQAGTVAADAGMSIEETTAAIAAMSNAGMQGSDAGTSMKTFFTGLLPVTKASREEFEKWGLSSYQSAASLKKLHDMGIKPVSSSMPDVSNAIRDYIVRTGQAGEGTMKLEDMTSELLYTTGMMGNAFVKRNGEFKSMTAIAGVLDKTFGHLAGTERAAALQAIFGSDARRAATVLTREGAEGLAKYVRATSDAKAADKQAAAATKGTAGALEQMRGSVETAQLAWGKAIKPVTMFGAEVVTKIANGAVPIIEDLGGVARKHLKDVDLTGITAGLKKVDVGAIFGKISDAVKGVDWKGVGDGFDKVGASFKDAGPSLQTASRDVPTLTDALDVGAVAVKFFADNADLLADALPYLALGFVAVKAAQAAANTAMLISVPVRIAEVIAMRAQTKALQSHTTAFAGSTLATNTATASTGRHAIATTLAAAKTKLMTAVTKAWTVAQKALNWALRMNPIGLVVTALVLLGAGLVLLYKKSETFRDIVNGVWAAVQKGASWMWKEVLKPMFGWLAEAFMTNVRTARLFWQGMQKAWDNVRDSTRGAVLWVADKVLWLAESMVGSMAAAFSWVPKLGDKLKTAKAAISDLRAHVNKEMDAIRDEEVKIGFAVGRRQSQENRSSGFGPGTGTMGGAGGFARAMGGAGGLTRVTAATSKAAAGASSVRTAAQSQAHAIAAELADKERRRRERQATAAGSGPNGAPGRVLPPGAYGIGMPYLGYPGHYGADYPAAAGTPVRSPWPGRVVFSGFVTRADGSPSYGNMVKVAHAGGVQTWYAHMSSRAGLGAVQAGGFIGRVGSTGNSTGNHLHFEYRKNGSPVNPASLGLFDRGGVARGKGVMLKEIARPERVLNPQQTESYDKLGRLIDILERQSGGRLEFRITNWETGEGYIERIADGRIAAHHGYDNVRDRMGRSS